MLALARKSSNLPRILELPTRSTLLTYRCNAVYRRRTFASDVKSPSDVLSKFSGLIHADQELRVTDVEAEAHNRRLSALRRALSAGDLLRVQEAYGDLVKKSEGPVLMSRDFQMISWMLEKHFSTCSSPTVDLITDMAIQAAIRGHTAGLHACLLLLLKVGDFRGVSAVYSRFYDLTEIDNVEKHATSTQLLETADDIQAGSNPSSSGPEVGDLVLIMLAAHAMEDRFYDAFDHFLATPTSIHIPAAKVQAFCRIHFSHDVSLSQKIQKWAEELVFLRLVYRQSSFHKYITSLGDDKQTSTLEKLYASVIAHLTKADGKLVVDLPPSSGENGPKKVAPRVVTVPNYSWGTFLEAFFKCHRLDLVDTLWNDVVRLGLIPDRHMWTALLDGYGRQKNCDMAMAVWNRMLAAGIEPDETSYGAMISAYFTASRPEEGYLMFEQFRKTQMQTTAGKDFIASPGVLRLFNIVLHGLCKNAMDDLARRVMKRMTEQGPKPDIVSFNTFLRHYERIGDMKNLSEVLRSLKPAGVQPDVHSFTTVLSALYKAGKTDAHTKTLQIMKAMGVAPNVATYSAIINFFARQGGDENLRKAGDLLAQMEHQPDKESRPNEITYTALLAGIHRDPSISPQTAKLYSAELLDRMRGQGKPPNRTTYHILIKACLENQQPVGLETALQYYYEMKKRGIKLMNDTWYVILAGLLRREDLALACEILKDMVDSGHEPNSALSTLIMRIQQKVASVNAQEKFIVG